MVDPIGQSLILSMKQSYGPNYEVFVGLDNFRQLLAD